MERLFILFLVAIMLAGCGRKLIVGHDIDGQDVPIPQQTQQAKEKTEEKAEEGTNSVVDSVEQNIEGQDVPIPQQVEAVREGMLVPDDATDAIIICGMGMIVGGVAVLWANATQFGGVHWITEVSLFSIQAGVGAVVGLIVEKAHKKALEWEMSKRNY